MAITNHERVGKALDLLKDGVRSFVERELKARDRRDTTACARRAKRASLRTLRHLTQICAHLRKNAAKHLRRQHPRIGIVPRAVIAVVKP